MISVCTSALAKSEATASSCGSHWLGELRLLRRIICSA
jgi:hypothetical protein